MPNIFIFQKYFSLINKLFTLINKINLYKNILTLSKILLSNYFVILPIPAPQSRTLLLWKFGFLSKNLFRKFDDPYISIYESDP